MPKQIWLKKKRDTFNSHTSGWVWGPDQSSEVSERLRQEGLSLQGSHIETPSDRQGCSSGTEPLASRFEALGSIPSKANK